MQFFVYAPASTVPGRVIEAENARTAIQKYAQELGADALAGGVYTALSDAADWPEGHRADSSPSVEELKAHTDNVNQLFDWIKAQGVLLSEKKESELRGRFDVKTRKFGGLDLADLAENYKVPNFINRAIQRLASDDPLDGLNLLLLAGYMRAHQIKPAAKAGYDHSSYIEG